MYKDKIRGCVIGGAVGDALGYPVEFWSDGEILSRFGRDGITDYYMNGSQALFSDDTQMTLFSANGVLNALTAAHLDPDAPPMISFIYPAYLDWYVTQHYDKPQRPVTWLADISGLYSRRAPGNTCLSALRSGRMGTVDEPLNFSKGCGGIMRAAPFGLVGSMSAEQAFDEACAAAAVTHGHPYGWMPAGALAYIVHQVVFDGAGLKEAALSCAGFVRGKYLSAEADTLAVWIEMAAELSANGRDDRDNIRSLDSYGSPAVGGWTGESALYISLYSALRFEHDFDKAVICAVNVGEDRDSTGAVAGNIVGAVNGLSAISDRWTEKLELKDVLLTLADDLYRCSFDPQVFSDEAWLSRYS